MEIAVKVIKKNRKNESIPVLPAIPQCGIGSYFFRGKALAWKPCLSTLQLGFRCHDQSGKPMPYRCKDCREHFGVRTGTVLSKSKLALRKWLMAIYLLHTARKGISSIQIA